MTLSDIKPGQVLNTLLDSIIRSENAEYYGNLKCYLHKLQIKSAGPKMDIRMVGNMIHMIGNMSFHSKPTWAYDDDTSED